jgi:hypothetical protein
MGMEGAGDSAPAASCSSASEELTTRKHPRSVSMILAGWLIIVAGLLAFSNGLMAFFGESSSIWFDIDIGVNRYSVCGTMIMAFGVVAVAGGISAVRGKNLSLALAGAALGTMGDGLVGFLFGLIAIVLLFLSNEDF